MSSLLCWKIFKGSTTIPGPSPCAGFSSTVYTRIKGPHVWLRVSESLEQAVLKQTTKVKYLAQLSSGLAPREVRQAGLLPASRTQCLGHTFLMLENAQEAPKQQGNGLLNAWAEQVMGDILGKCFVGFQRHTDLYQQNMTEALTLKPLGENFLRYPPAPPHTLPTRKGERVFPTKQYKPLSGDMYRN